MKESCEDAVKPFDDEIKESILDFRRQKSRYSETTERQKQAVEGLCQHIGSCKSGPKHDEL